MGAKIPFNKPFIAGKELYYISQAVTFGNIGVSIRGLRRGPQSDSWISIFGIRRQFDHIAVDADPTARPIATTQP